MTVQILLGDVFDQLKNIPDESVDCVVTSPPYWGLRDYGVAGQIGLEPTLGEHLEVMVRVFREVRRVLKKSGTLWLNYGDCYATSPNGRSAAATKAKGDDDRTFRDKPFSTIGPINDEAFPRGEGARRGGGNNPAGAIYEPDCDILAGKHDYKGNSVRGRIRAGGYLKPKDLCMIPNRLAIALQDDGWWVRSEIIWSKPNPMPDSVKDRPTNAHEKIWLLTKSAKYFYNADAVRQGLKKSSMDRLSQDIENQAGSERANAGGKTNGPMKAVSKKDKQRGHSRRHEGFNERWDQMTPEEQQASGANLRNVWTIATRGFSEAHFATFPPELPEMCIKAGCPEGGAVLDPFAGAGTTGLVADRLGRDCILIELNKDYAAMAEGRIHNDAPMMVDVKVNSTWTKGAVRKSKRKQPRNGVKNGRSKPNAAGRTSGAKSGRAVR